MNAEREFWTFVESGEEPPVDGTVSTENTISELYPTSEDVTVDLALFEKDVEEYFRTKQMIKDLTEQNREIENKIKDYLGDAGHGDSENFKVAYTVSERETFDSKGFRKANPTIDVTPYLKKSPTRTFKITQKGE